MTNPINIQQLIERISSYATEGSLDDDFKKSMFYITNRHMLLNGRIPLEGMLKGAKTNGKRIYMQYAVEEFGDDFGKPADDNRNVTVHRGFYVHENCHILEGTFFIDWTKFGDEFDNPKFALELLNVVDDYRSEFNFINTVSEGEKLKENLDFINTYYAIKFPYHMLEAQEKPINPFMEMMLRGIKAQQKGALFREKPSRFEDYHCAGILTPEEKKDRYTYWWSLDPAVRWERFRERYGYSSVAELYSFERDFCRSPTMHVADLGYQTYGNMLDDIVRRTHGLKYKSVVDAAIHTRWLYDLLVKEFGPDVSPDDFPVRPCDGMQEGKSNEKEENPGSDFDEMEIGVITPSGLDELIKDRKKFEREIHENAAKLNDDYKENGKKGTPKQWFKVQLPDNFNSRQDSDENHHYVHVWRGKGYGPRVRVNQKELEPHSPYDLNGYRREIQTLRANLEELYPNEMQIIRMTDQPGVFNPFGLYMSRVDPIAAMNVGMYDATKINTLDWGLTLLMDCSGSTSSHIDGIPIYRRIQDCAAVMDSSLDSINGIDVEKYFYTDNLRDNQPWLYHAPTLDCFNGINYLGNNYDASCVRAVTEEINMNGHQDNILMIFADGYPISLSGEDAALDLSRAIYEARIENGIEVYYFLTRMGGINGRGNEDKEKFDVITRYATGAYEINHPENLIPITKMIVEDYML